MKKRILIIRFSSIGDVLQCMSFLQGIKKKFKDGEVSWVIREDLKDILSLSGEIDKIYAFDRKMGLLGLVKLALSLRRKNFDYVYDVHANIRSHILSFILTFLKKVYFLKWPKHYLKQFLFFKFKINCLSQEFQITKSFRRPLQKWGIEEFPMPLKLDFSSIDHAKFDLVKGPFICFIPSSAWKLKRWPVEHYIRLGQLLKDYPIVILGGQKDEFCQKIADSIGAIGLAGKLNLKESIYMVSKAALSIGGDTGLTHASDLMGVKTLFLIGPAAYGRPIGENTKILELDLLCRPCSKAGRKECKFKRTKDYGKCLAEISPEFVAIKAKELLNRSSSS